MTTQERFDVLYLVDHKGCWLWAGGKNDKMRGSFSINGKNTSAHRASWLLHRGEIPPGFCVCHTCDVPYCVNPDHLFLGTQRDNLLDCVSKGRHPFQRDRYNGERNHHHRFAQADVEQIRQSSDSGAVLARRYGTSVEYIRQLRVGVRWGHLRALAGEGEK